LKKKSKQTIDNNENYESIQKLIYIEVMKFSV
jgi:hypothetical protein